MIFVWRRVLNNNKKGHLCSHWNCSLLLRKILQITKVCVGWGGVQTGCLHRWDGFVPSCALSRGRWCSSHCFVVVEIRKLLSASCYQQNPKGLQATFRDNSALWKGSGSISKVLCARTLLGMPLRFIFSWLISNHWCFWNSRILTGSEIGWMIAGF